MADHISRRDFVRTALQLSAALGTSQLMSPPSADALLISGTSRMWPHAARNGSDRAAQIPWRTFEVRVDVAFDGAGRAIDLWLPVPLSRDEPFQKLVEHRWSGNARQTEVVTDPRSGAMMLSARWPAGVATPLLEQVFVVATADHHVALAPRPTTRPATLATFLRPTVLIPVNGIVRDTARRITAGHKAELSRARAIYDWIVDNTFRDPKVQGCGLGDIRWMLESGSLGGKCADLNALFVGLCRSIGLPARDLYGLRLAPSAHFTSLGRVGGDVTTAQHCRAQVWVDQIGWIPVDPADVRKVVLEERPGLALEDADVRRARDMLFGSWEMNWVAFNDTHDVILPGSTGKPLPFLMYPQAEVNGVRRDALDAAAFRYRITAKGHQV